MMQAVTTPLLWFCALGCGLLAGLYFAFSAFIMTALGSVEQAHGAAAMNAINSTILKSLFMPVFTGTTLASLALAIIAVLRWGQPGTALMLIGGLGYVAGMFVVTMVRNVPLNNALAAVDPSAVAAAPVWAQYLKEWTFWNHIRTISSLAAAALFIVAIGGR